MKVLLVNKSKSSNLFKLKPFSFLIHSGGSTFKSRMFVYRKLISVFFLIIYHNMNINTVMDIFVLVDFKSSAQKTINFL